MEWIESRINTSSEGVEPVMGVLLSCGITGAQIIDNNEMKQFIAENPLQWDYVDESLMGCTDEQVYVVFYVSGNPAGRETLLNIESAVKALPALQLDIALGDLLLTSKTVDEEDWLHEWKKHYKPFKIGKSVVVKPVWESYTAEPPDIVFTINPGSVFGTGLHQTTRLCIEALEEYITPDVQVLDIGCGSGILSVTALLLGAGYAFACDLEPAAVDVVHENAALNHINNAQLTVRTGNIFTDAELKNELTGQRFHIIVANIVADAIIGLSSMVGTYLNQDGIFIASGIISERCGEVAAALQNNGFRPIRVMEKDGWFCIITGAPDA